MFARIPDFLQLLLELQQIGSARPITRDELQPHQHAAAARMAGMGQTLSRVCHAVEQLLHHALPDDGHMRHAERIAGLTPAAVNAAVRELARPAHLCWLVVGDREVVVPQLHNAGWKTQLLMQDDT